jgi:hypothetical protein
MSAAKASDDELIACLTRDRAGYRTLGNRPVNWADTVQRCRKAYPDAVPYTVVDGTGRTCYGMRYGFQGHEYMSF